MPAAASLKPAQPIELTRKIDRAAYLILREQAAKPERDELVRLKAELQLHCAGKPADLPVHLDGADYYLDLSQRELRQEITDKPKAFKALQKAVGLSSLIEKLTITFKLLDAYVPKDKQSGYVTSERTGSRDIAAGLLKTPTAA